MEPAAELLYDHEVLRGKLALLESTLLNARNMPATVLLLVDQLAVLLRHHTTREEHFLKTLQQSHVASVEALGCVCDAHDNHRMQLAILRELLLRGEAEAMTEVVAHGRELIRDLRALMVCEEAEWFPALQRQWPHDGSGTTFEEAMERSVASSTWGEPAHAYEANTGGDDGTH